MLAPAMRRFTAVGILLGGLVFGAVVLAQAQSYNISWFTIAGGGGTSSGTNGGTVYSISGTIGQSDAGVMSGGNYTVTGGFWGIIGTVQTAGAPLLSISTASPNVIVSWPASAGNYLLQKNSNLNVASGWSSVSQSTNQSGGTNYVTVPATGGNLYFRLTNSN